MTDLFSWRDEYPHAPAARNTETSRAAAASMKPRVKSLRDRILDHLRTGIELTPDELASRLGVSILSARPRCTELDRLGMILPTGETRINAVSGHRAQVYRIAAYGE